jgi:hypothetical protein
MDHVDLAAREPLYQTDLDRALSESCGGIAGREHEWGDRDENPQAGRVHEPSPVKFIGPESELRG